MNYNIESKLYNYIDDHNINILNNCSFSSFIDASLENEYNNHMLSNSSFPFFIPFSFGLLFLSYSTIQTIVLQYSLTIMLLMFALCFVYLLLAVVATLLKSVLELQNTSILLLNFLTLYTAFIIIIISTNVVHVELLIRYIYLGGISLIVSYIILLKDYSRIIVFFAILFVELAVVCKAFENGSLQEFALEYVFVIGLMSFYSLKSSINKDSRSIFLKLKSMEKIHNYYKKFLNEANFELVTLVDSKPVESNILFDDSTEIFISDMKDKTHRPLPSCEYDEIIRDYNIDMKSDNKIFYLNSILKYDPREEIKDIEAGMIKLSSDLTKEITLLECIQNYLKDCFEKFDVSKSFIDFGHFYQISNTKKRILSIQLRAFRVKNKSILMDIIIKDVSLINKIEREATEFRLKQKVFSKFAHEFKTPFIIISSELKDLSHSFMHMNFELAKKSDLLSHLSSYCLFLIDDVIQYSSNFEKLQINLDCCINLEEIATFTFNILNSYKEYSPGNKKIIQSFLLFDKAIEKYEVCSDPIRLKQILLNFVSNSVKFTKQGEIRLKFELNEQKESIRISISDTGVGMTTTLVDLFNTEVCDAETNPIEVNLDKNYNQMGSGIGLAISKGIINKMPNHTLMIESTINLGTTVIVEIGKIRRKEQFEMSSSSLINIKEDFNISNKQFTDPLDADDLETTIKKTNYTSKSLYMIMESKDFKEKHTSLKSFLNLLRENASQFSLNRQSGKPKIIIIDDSYSIRRAINNLLKSMDCLNNYDIVEGEDGVDLLKFVISDQLSGNNDIKLAITDENMEFLNGSDSIKIIRSLENSNKLTKKLTIISLTAFSDETTKASILKSGASKVLLKPITKSDIFSICKQYLI